MKIVKDSHMDHGLCDEIIAEITEKFADKDGFFIETFEAVSGEAPCGLYGPIVGDAPVDERDVYYTKRGDREYDSRMVKLPMRMTNTITVIAGPHEDDACVLYTAYAGPQAPMEPGDPKQNAAEVEDNKVFWAKHALCE
jgi:hypothetical protein